MKKQKIKMWRKIKSEMGLQKIFYHEDEFEIIKTLVVEGKNIPVAKNSEHLHCQGISPAATSVFEGFENPTIIVVDEYFEMLPETVQEFFIQHEVGHILNGDINQTKEVLDNWLEERKKCNIPECEFYADFYAATQIGFDTAINALKFMVRETDVYSGTKLEFNRRIKYLEDMEKMEDASKEKQKEEAEKHIEKHRKTRKIAAVIASPYFAAAILIGVLFAVIIVICRGKYVFKSLKRVKEKTSSFIKKLKKKYL